MAAPKVDTTGQTTAQLAEQAGVSQAGLLEQQIIDPTQNPDVMVGGALMNQKTQDIQVDEKGREYPYITDPKTGQKTYLKANQTVTSSAGVGRYMDNQLGQIETLADQTDSELADIYSQQQDVITRQRELLKTNMSHLEEKVKQQTESAIRGAEEQQRQAVGMARSQLARMGALNVASSGVVYLNDLEVKHQQQVADIRMKAVDLMTQARIAKEEKDIELVEKSLNMMLEAREEMRKDQEEYRKGIEFSLKLQQFQRDNASDTLDMMAESGVDVPDSYLSALDAQLGMPSGVSRGILNMAKREREIADIKDVMEAEKASIEQAKQLTDLLAQLPAGEPVNVNGFTYYGTMGTGNVSVDPEGFGQVAVIDQATGQMKLKDLGYVGKPEDGWKLYFDGEGRPWSFNENTNSLKYMGDPAENVTGVNGADFAAVIPSDSWGGQCGSFVRKWTGIRVGDALADKVAVVDESIGTDENPVQVGDVMVTSEGGWTGHVAIVNAVIDTGPGSGLGAGLPEGAGTGGDKMYVLTESNYKGTEKVTHTRQISANSSVIQGFARGELDPRLRQGTDSPSFAPKSEIETKVINDKLYERQSDGTWRIVVDATSPTASERDITMGGKILRKNRAGGYDIIYELPEDKKTNSEIKERDGQWYSIDKDTKEATLITGDDGLPLPAVTGDPSTDPRQIAENMMKPYSKLKITDVKTELKPAVEAELSKLRDQAMENGDTTGILLASAGGTNISADERKGLNKAFVVVDQVRNLTSLFEDDKALRNKTKTPENKKGWDLAPITNIWRSRNPFDEKAMEIKAQLSSVVPNLARGVYGEVGVLTDKDVEIYSRTLPNLGSTEAVRKGVLSLTIKTIASSVRHQLETAAMSGADVSAFADKYIDLELQSADLMFQAMGKVTLETPDGQKWVQDGRMHINDLKDALNQGYKINFDLL